MALSKKLPVSEIPTSFRAKQWKFKFHISHYILYKNFIFCLNYSHQRHIVIILSTVRTIIRHQMSPLATINKTITRQQFNDTSHPNKNKVCKRFDTSTLVLVISQCIITVGVYALPYLNPFQIAIVLSNLIWSITKNPSQLFETSDLRKKSLFPWKLEWLLKCLLRKLRATSGILFFCLSFSRQIIT